MTMTFLLIVSPQVSLQELLVAAGVGSLDVASDTVNSKGRSFRERGVILRVTISYQNWFNTWIGARQVCMHA